MQTDIEAVRAVAAAHKDTPGGLLPALHDIQDRFGHVPAAAVGAIAGEFNLSRAEVHGVISYYHHFRAEPAGEHVVQLCQAEACRSMGAEALSAHAQARLGCSMHATSADHQFTLEPVYCLGLCAMSPAMAIDGEVHARIDAQAFDALIDELGSHQ